MSLSILKTLSVDYNLRVSDVDVYMTLFTIFVGFRCVELDSATLADLEGFF